ncbi:hypothetical protein DVH05_026262 [Phytophthora capsici]|nr:hypothetical protein DVH05_026241 [Phytophthora capsici]KAG1707066.1 hypothetical protein DVH05_026262 [Phytophthora capsici]
MEENTPLSLPPAQQTDKENLTVGGSLVQPAGPARKNFTTADDLILLRAVNTIKPWESAKGTANGIMKSFDKIADICNEMAGFVRDKQGPALRTRFDKLIRQHRDAQVVSRRSSGTTEEYNERDELLQDIVTRMDDWKERQDSEKQLQRAKDNGIEASGVLMRRLAMGELAEELQSDTNSNSDGGNEGQDEGANAGTSLSGSQKRGHRAGSGRATKVGKIERVAAVTDAIAMAITEMNKGNPEKYVYLNSRLQFEKDEAERKRDHELKLEQQRQEAERARDERMQAAERDREKFMLQLLEIALGRAKDKQ